MENKHLTCTACPRGCRLSIEIQSSESEKILGDLKDLKADDIKVFGNKCPKGAVYGKQELICPMRMLTTTVATESKVHPRLPVKTSSVVPLKDFSKYMQKIRSIKIETALKPGDVIIENFCGTGSNLIATGEV